jgi:hypothetical protein
VRLCMLPDELLARSNSAQLSELMAHFKMSDDDAEAQRKLVHVEGELTGFFGEASDA